MSTEIKEIITVSPVGTPTRRKVVSKACSTPTTPGIATDLTVRNLTVEHLTILKLTPSSRKRFVGSSSDEIENASILTPSKKDKKKSTKKCTDPYKIEWREAVGTEEVREHVELAVLVANSQGLTGNERADAVIKYLDNKLGGDWSCVCHRIGRELKPAGFITHKHFYYTFYHEDMEWIVWASSPINKYNKKNQSWYKWICCCCEVNP